MATRHRVRCIHRTDRPEPPARVHAIGGANRDGSAWKLTQAEAVRGIDDGRWAFYLEGAAGGQVELVVAIDRLGRRYLRTAEDGDEPASLLALPECQ